MDIIKFVCELLFSLATCTRHVCIDTMDSYVGLVVICTKEYVKNDVKLVVAVPASNFRTNYSVV